MKLEILDLAKDDLIEAYYFYESQENGLGNYFLSNLYQDIESLTIFAGIHRQVYKNFFRSLSAKFPFAIYYTIENEIIFIRSIVDCRRKPSWIKQHLNK